MTTSRYIFASLFAISSTIASIGAFAEGDAPAPAASAPMSASSTPPASASSVSLPVPATSVAAAPMMPAKPMPNTKKTGESYELCVKEKTAATETFCLKDAAACAVDKKAISAECHGEVEGFKKKGAKE